MKKMGYTRIVSEPLCRLYYIVFILILPVIISISILPSLFELLCSKVSFIVSL